VLSQHHIVLFQDGSHRCLPLHIHSVQASSPRDPKKINVILKGKLRFDALRLLAKNWMSTRALSKKLGCREEVVRRLLSDMKKLNIVMEQARISSRGRPIKVYKLATPIIVIDLRHA